MSDDAQTNTNVEATDVASIAAPEPADSEKLTFANSRAIDAVHGRLVMIETALDAVLRHLDPHGTSAAFDNLRALAERRWTEAR